MRKRVFGRKLKRTTNQRKALFRSLMRGMILHGKIKTTEAKAKAIKGELERLVTIVKRKQDSSARTLLKKLAQGDLVEAVIKNIAPKFASRPGGYTRIIRLGTRLKDGSPMVLMEWTEPIQIESAKSSTRISQAEGLRVENDNEKKEKKDKKQKIIVESKRKVSKEKSQKTKRIDRKSDSESKVKK